MARRGNKADKYRERELEDSCIDLRRNLGDDDSVPYKIQFSAGQEVQIDTNCYSLSLSNHLKITQYVVSIEPEILSSKVSTHFVYTALCSGGRQSENERWQHIIFDGQRILYSTFPDLEKTYEVPGRSGPVFVKIQRTRDVSAEDSSSLLAIYNTAFRQAYRQLGLTNFRRKWLNETKSTPAGAFRIVEGFSPSIVSLSGGLSYVVDVASRIDRDGSLFDFLRRGVEHSPARHEIAAAFRSFQLTTTHRERNRQIIASTILWDRHPNSVTFQKVDRTTGESREITLADYYLQAYNIHLPPEDVIIESAARGPAGNVVNMYPSSILKIAGISDAERRDGRVMREIATVTKIDAQARKRRLQEFVESLRTVPKVSNFLTRWGFEVGDSRQPKGRRIAPPKLVMCQQRSNKPIEVPLDDRLKFQGQLKDHSLFEVASFVSNYLIIAPSSARDVVENELVRMLRDMSDGLGAKFPQADLRFVDNSHPNDYCRAISDAVSQTVPAFVVVVLPGPDSVRYNGVKDFLTVHLGLPSQFIKLETLCGDRSKYTNIAIQIAAKTGGVPYRVSSTYLKTSRTMVIGLAIQSSRGGGAPVAAGVASKNHHLTHFYSDSLMSGEGDPLIPVPFLQQFIAGALNAYKTENGGELPTRIVVYREGVSYGLMARVKKQEITAIQDSLPAEGEPISLTFLIAHKHVAIRILEKKGGVSNAGAGTVVTEGVGAKGVAEFYLISHYANQGSASPTRYTIIHHAPAVWKDDEIVLMTHYQTLQYPNWAGSIRIPACLMLASRLAEFSRLHLGSEPAANQLRDYLHYL